MTKRRSKSATRLRTCLLIGALTPVNLTSVCFGAGGDSSVNTVDPLPSPFAPSAIRRGAGHDGINSLLLLLRFYAYESQVEQFSRLNLSQSLPDSAVEILDLARSLGAPLEARSITPEDLDNLQLPVIIHVDGSSPSEGAFHVLVQTGPSRISYVNGAAVAVEVVDKEAFLRKWSGVIIYPHRPLLAPSWSMMLAFALGLAGTLVARAIRNVRSTTHV